MELLDDDKASLKEAEQSIQEILEQNDLLSLATVSEKEKAFNATAFYVFDDNFKFYILTEPETDHGENLEENSSASLSIYNSKQEWGDAKKGLQVFGEAEHISEEDKVSMALKLYLERFPELKQWVSQPGEMENIDSEFYIIRPERIKIFDEPKFGTETWVNMIF
jgi:uncharacterized protein YhbP (UPF0306 family)